MLLIFTNVEKGNMTARYNSPWQPKMRNYKQFKLTKVLPVETKKTWSPNWFNLCLLEVSSSLILWTAELPLHKVYPPSKKKWLLMVLTSLQYGRAEWRVYFQGSLQGDSFHQIYNISKSTCRTSGFRFWKEKSPSHYSQQNRISCFLLTMKATENTWSNYFTVAL